MVEGLFLVVPRGCLWFVIVVFPDHNHLLFFKVAPKLCIFLYNAMETTGVHQGMIIMHSGVMDTVFHNGDAGDSMP